MGLERWPAAHSACLSSGSIPFPSHVRQLAISSTESVPTSGFPGHTSQNITFGNLLFLKHSRQKENLYKNEKHPGPKYDL